MLRQVSSRNHRSKGFKVKHALQICLLVAICIWLIYQVKHSQEKKRAFEERNLKLSNKEVDSKADFFKFGRKDLPHVEKKGSVNEAHSKEEENEETQEEEEELDTRQEEPEDEEVRMGDDGIDEHDQEKADEEVGNGEEFTEEEEKDKDNHNEEKDEHEEMDLVDNSDHEGVTQEAREENYKRDDASSAVVHDTHVTESNLGSGVAGNTDEEQVTGTADDQGANGSKNNDNSGISSFKHGDNSDANGSRTGENIGEAMTHLDKKVLESGHVANETDDHSKVDNNLSAEAGGASVGNVSDTLHVSSEVTQSSNLSSNTRPADKKDIKVEFYKPENGSVSDSASVERDGHMQQQSNLTNVAESNTQLELQNNSTSLSDNQSEMGKNSRVVDAVRISMSNDTANLVSAQNQNVATSNTTLGEISHNLQNIAESIEKSNTTEVLSFEQHSNDSGNEAQGQPVEKSNTNMLESIEKHSDENVNIAQGELHASITEEERDARTDLSTLPDIQNEVKIADDEAAE